MKYLVVLVVALVGFVAADNAADYVPRAFFSIDSNGNPTPLRPIDSETLNRVRRQIQPFQPFGQPFGFQPFPQGGIPANGQGTFTSSSQTLSSRFGEDDIVTGHQTVVTGSGGKFTQTTHQLNPDGSVSTSKQSGRVKRQQSQNQSQNQDGGSQTQQQSQNQDQGQQSQIQSQGQGPEPLATPVGQPQTDNRVPENNGNIQAENRNPVYPTQGNSYPAGQAYSPFGAAPFGFGAFGQQGFGFPQAGFGFQGQPGFGFPQAGFGPGFGQPGFGFPVAGGFGPQQGFAPGPGTQTISTGSQQTLDNRFGEEEPVVTGGTQTITSQNGNYQITSSVLKPNGQVVTTQQSGKFPQKKN